MGTGNITSATEFQIANLPFSLKISYCAVSIIGLGVYDVATRDSLAAKQNREHVSDKVVFVPQKKNDKGILGIAPCAQSASINCCGEIPVKLVMLEEVKPNFRMPS